MKYSKEKAMKHHDKKEEEVPQQEPQAVQDQAQAGTDAQQTGETPTDKQAEEPDLQQELAKQKDAFLRLYAEFDNYKKRTAREKTEWIKYASSDVLSALLPVLDDFERGLAAEEKERPGSAEAEGFRLIYNKMMEVLRQKGLAVVEVHPGDELDVDYHDAIARIPAPQKSLKGKIVDITQKGYKIGDRVIRYAKVVVGE
mgnify:CR=1 FL=1